jgi:hypothetical protein
MQHSLLNRFHGAFLGALIGEKLGSDCSQGSLQQQIVWMKAAISGAKSLIELGRLDPDDWREALQFEALSTGLCPTSVIAATLPVYLFYHDSETALQQNLLSLVSLWHDDAVLRDGSLAIGYVLSRSLKEKLSPTDLLPKTLEFLGQSSTHLAKQIAQVQTLLERGSPLEKVLTQLARDNQPTTPIALAFYCFLSSLEDFRLSILRATQTGSHSHQTAILTGALSGAYNSRTGISATLQMTLFRPQTKSTQVAWTISEVEMLQLMKELLAAWSGVYDRAIYQINSTRVPVIAAPRVIRLP